MRAIVVFGSSLTAGGDASPSLLRRVAYAVEAASRHPEAPLFCSGGARPGLPSEAAVIGGLVVEAGVASDRVVLDEASRDTLQTAVAATAFMRRMGFVRAVVCTESFHMPRARMLLAALGAPSEPGCDSGRPLDAPSAYWRRMALREAAAYPYDFAVIRWRRRELLATIEADRRP